MGEYKYLIKKEKISFLGKFIIFFKELFFRKKPTIEIQQGDYNKTNDLKIEIEEQRKILSIQEKYEQGFLDENKMTEEEKEKLIQLYKKQINTLENDIDNYKRILENYKQKIILARKDI